ncbi:protein kinase domain-containing protein [Acinetobacter sp. ESBL14]|uniref:protein kinase domain-containing protein n=1 Tax=Acinetobacter sp. ESBL14 TaxID=3077329 RepID=UPI002FC9A5B9
MSFTTWISDPEIQLEDLRLRTKAQSYAFGRRVYTFQVEQQGYWLKFHQADSHPILEQAFLRELDFYQKFKGIEQNFLLPYAIISLSQIKSDVAIDQARQGLVSIDSPHFFIPISASESLNRIKQKILSAFEALDSLHQAGWVHGDLKTEHFRLYGHSCRLIDFEQCFRIGQPMQSLDATPHYMAPELFHGAGKSIQSDLYALGVIVYEWLTQSRLTASTYHDWAVLHCQQLQIQLPIEFEVFLPLLNGLTQKHVKQRFNSVLAAKNSLNAIDLP